MIGFLLYIFIGIICLVGTLVANRKFKWWTKWDADDAEGFIGVAIIVLWPMFLIFVIVMLIGKGLSKFIRTTLPDR